MNKKSRLLVSSLLSLISLSTIGCGGNTTPSEVTPLKAVDAKMVVSGKDAGPVVDKVIFEFEDVVTNFTKDTFTIKAGSKRKVLDAYNSNDLGVKSNSPTKYVAFELETSLSFGGFGCNDSPFTYGQMEGASNSANTWSKTYSCSISSKKAFKVGNYEYDGSEKIFKTLTVDTANKKIVNDVDKWTKDSYEHQGIKLNRALFTPEGVTTDSGKNPLVIWLHGAGEGGTDIDIDLLGNEVTALGKEKIQSYFAKNGLKGAYALAVQTPTMWMDKGDGTYNQTVNDQKQTSKYTEALYATITDFVSNHSDVDTSRIYIGGCSNGGYMTMNMMFEHGDYFTAFYPICQAYKNRNISDEMINQVKEYNIWFLQSEDDTTVNPLGFSVPTFKRLIDAGAENVHFTFTENVQSEDFPGNKLAGHYSWAYAFKANVKKEFDNALVKSSEMTISEDTKEAAAGSYVTNRNCSKDADMWDWMSKQVKSA